MNERKLKLIEALRAEKIRLNRSIHNTEHDMVIEYLETGKLPTYHDSELLEACIYDLEQLMKDYDC